MTSTHTPSPTPSPTGFKAATTGGPCNWAVWNDATDEMVTGYMFEDEARKAAAEMNRAV